MKYSMAGRVSGGTSALAIREGYDHASGRLSVPG